MKKVLIKLISPYNWYQARSIKVKDDKGNTISKIPINSINEVEVDSDIKIRIDYFRTKVKFDDLKVDDNGFAYVVAVIGKPNDHLGLKSTFSNALSSSVVSEAEFKNASIESVLDIKNFTPEKIDIFFALSTSLATGLLILANVLNPSDNSEFSFICVLSALIGLTTMYADRKNLSRSTYLTKSVATIVGLALGTFFAETVYIGVDFSNIMYLLLLTGLVRVFTPNAANAKYAH